MKKTILVTGGLGFIGTNLVKRLLRVTDYHIVILDKSTYAGRIENILDNAKTQKRVKIIKGDVTKKRDVNDAIKNVTSVVHMAADTHASRSLKNALPIVRTNVIGTTILLEAVEKHEVERFILLSSSEVYGDQIKGVPMDEKHPLNPVTPYAASKLASDRIAYSFFLAKKLPVVIIRPFNAYGPYQHLEKMIPLFITRLLRGLPITLNHGGKPKRDWVYVDDHGRAIETLLKEPNEKVLGEIFNIGTGKATSIKDIAQLILKALGMNSSYLKIKHNSLPETAENVGISKKAKKILGWTPKISLEEGIQKTVQWYKNNRLWWEKIV